MLMIVRAAAFSRKISGSSHLTFPDIIFFTPFIVMHHITLIYYISFLLKITHKHLFQ